jgi:hypothetical protein
MASIEGNAGTLTTLAPATPLQIDGAIGRWFRVRLPDQTAGYVASRFVERAQRAVGRRAVASGTPLRDQPSAGGAVITTSPGGTLPVFGEFAGYELVEIGERQTGWVAATPAGTTAPPGSR